MVGIYCYENMIDGKKYVGQSIDLEKRISIHEGFFLKQKYPKSENRPLWNAIKKHGRENFKLYIIEECSVDNLDDLEEQYIIKLESHVSENGYNILKRGFSRRGIPHSEETIEKIRESTSGENAYWFGKKRSQETIEKMRFAFKGEKSAKYGTRSTDETRKAISEANLGTNHPNFGNKKETASSKYRGVTGYLDKGKYQYWQVKINYLAKIIYLGSYKNEIEAAKVYDLYIVENDLPHILNFPEDYS